MMKLQIERGITPLVFFTGLLFSFIFYSALLLYPNVIDFRDMPRVLLPFEHMVRGLFERTVFPLWNPMGGLGKPLFADPLSGLTYPLQYLFRLLPEPFGWNASIAFHHFLAFLGAFLFLRVLSIGKPGATIGALCFSFGGYTVATDNMLNALQSVSWFPWVFWSFHFVLLGKRPLRWIALSALFVGLTFLGGMPEVVGYELALLGIVVLFPLWVVDPMHIVMRMSAVLAIFVLSFGLSAISFLPLYDFLLLSTRSTGLAPEAITELSFDPLRILEFVYPWSFLGEVGHTPWAVSVVIGPVLIFALLAPFCARPSSSILVILLFGFFLLAAMGRYVPGYEALVDQFSLLRIARHPEKFLLVPHGLLCLAIGFGYDRMLGRKISGPGHVMMTIIVWSSLWVLNSRLHPLASWNELLNPPATIKPFQGEGNNIRLYADGVGPSTRPQLVEDPIVQKALFLHHFGLFYGLNNVNAPSSLNLASGEKLINFIETAGPERLADHLALFSIPYVTSTQTLAKVRELQPLGNANKVNVFSVPNVRPRAYVPRNILVTDNPGEMEYTLAQIAEHPGDAVVLSQTLDPGWKQSTGQILRSSFGVNQLDFQVRFDTHGFLIINDAYHPDWRVECEPSCETQLFLANGYVRAVSVPAGEHTIRLTFQPRAVIVGSVITILSLIVCLWLIFPLGFPRR